MSRTARIAVVACAVATVTAGPLAATAAAATRTCAGKRVTISGTSGADRLIGPAAPS